MYNLDHQVDDWSDLDVSFLFYLPLIKIWNMNNSRSQTSYFEYSIISMEQWNW